ncbi:hypothetical protein HK102_014084, partial [Quaeritorhiza haematococci]
MVRVSTVALGVALTTASLTINNAFGVPSPQSQSLNEVSASSSVAGTTPATARISPLVLEDFDIHEEREAGPKIVSFMVQMRNILEPSSLLSKRAENDWVVRGREVYDQLKDHARTSNAAFIEVLKELQENGDVKYWNLFEISNTFVVDGSVNALEKISRRSEVDAITPNRQFEVDLPQPVDDEEESNDRVAEELAELAEPEWGVTMVNSVKVWDMGFNGGNLTYANADTGVAWEHPSLRSNYLGVKPDGSVDHNYAWWDAIRTSINGPNSACPPQSPAPCDDNGHGTHCVSTSVGINGIGVAPGARWMACRNMDNGIGRPETYLGCLNFFLAPHDLQGKNPDPSRRPHAVGNSYGCPSDELCEKNTFSTAVKSLRAAGIFMAVSAGNDGSSCSTVNDPPAIEPSVMSVAAVGRSKNLAGFSSRGPVPGRGPNNRGVDISAPGVGVRAAYPPNTFRSLSGTSMASPHLGGAAMLLVNACPAVMRDVDKMQSLFEQTAFPLFSSQGCGGDKPDTIPNNGYGYGLLDVYAAVQKCLKEN